MRIATLILSLILMLIVGAQSCAVSVGESVLNEPERRKEERWEFSWPCCSS
jgi:hypothetical protein